MLDSALSRIGVYTLTPISKNVFTPRKMVYDHFITAIDSYRNQTLAIDEEGNVISWGEGYYADNSISMTVKPYPTIIEPYFMNNPVQVSRGKNHNLVLDSAGNVWGWGSNTNFPMGDYFGKLTSNTELRCISNVKQVAAGTEFSIFLKKDGTLWGIGKNDVGQLGQGGTEQESYSSPVQITDEHNFKKVSVGEDYAVALTNDNEIYTWGNNTKGQLGNGTRKNMDADPKKITFNLSDGEYVCDIAAGIYFAMALTSKGDVYAWGDNESGEIGQDNKGLCLTPTKVKYISNITDIAAGKTHALAVKNTGEAVYGWGYGRDGQLGFNSTGSVLLPREITALSNKGIKSVSCGNNFSVALSFDGTVYTFGNNEYSQLGTHYPNTTETSSPIANDIEWLNDYMAQYDKMLTDSIELPTISQIGSNIIWSSSDEEHLSSSGIVTRPFAYSDNAVAELSATIYNSAYAFGYIKTEYKFYIKKKDINSELSSELPERIKNNKLDVDIVENSLVELTSDDVLENSGEDVETAADHEHSSTERYVAKSKRNISNSQLIFDSFIPAGDKVTALSKSPDDILYISLENTANTLSGIGNRDNYFYNESISVSNAVAKNDKQMKFSVFSPDGIYLNKETEFMEFTSCYPDIFEPNQNVYEAGYTY